MNKHIKQKKQKFKNLNSILLISSFLFNLQFVHAEQSPFFESGQNPAPVGQTWNKVDQMSDEFDGTRLNTDKWQAEPVGNGWMWNGRPPGLFDAKAVSVAEGSLRVTVSQLPSAKTIKGKTFLYQGAIVRSINPGQHGWYYETKMKANKTEMSSTFWLMTKNIPSCDKKHELDIQENVGVISPDVHSWAVDWDHIFHSNAIHRTTSCQPKAERDENFTLLPMKNWEKYFVYGAWWKSPTEILFFLDGKYQYTLNPTTDFDQPMWLQMAIETYDWNPVPSDGGNVKAGTWEERTTQYKWIRTWKLNK